MIPRNPGLFAVVVAAFLPLADSAEGATRYVKPGGSGNQSGSSWTNASGNIQTMITASSSGDQVWVAKGTYVPGTAQSDSFSIDSSHAGVQVYGGFSGSETSLTQRNWLSNVTILSGDIGTIGDPSDNAASVVTIGAVPATPATILDGFTITGANGGSGAIFLDASSNPTIQNCRVTGNFEPGLYCTGGAQPLVQDCVFDHNTAGSGAGIVFAATSGAQTSPQVIRCRFESNVATNSGGAILHGQNGNLNSGVFGTLLVRDCVFIANEARGSGTSAGGGAAWLQTASHARFVQCLFSRNRGFRSAGAMWCSNTINAPFKVFFTGGSVCRARELGDARGCHIPFFA